ncbi:MAG: heat-inducible transcriptional repressor HrcA, partial [Simkania negevensis]|nr:heat-inducible transcriptional repressor HrcA [Simkania negevensis]
MGPQKKNKEEKKQSLLLGLVDLYLQTGKAISSNSLKDNGFASISSATIRNYFAFLEEEGYLVQKHASGGRVPTDLAYKVYAKHYLEGSEPTEKEIKKIRKNLEEDAKDVARYLEHSAEVLSELSGSAIFLSSPRFDQDLIVDVKLVGIDQKRCLAVVVTNFGLIHSEILHLQKKLSHFAFKRIENFFRFRMTGLNRPLLSPEEEKIGQDFYNEILLRYIVDYSNFSAEDLYKTGFSKLLHYPEFHDTTALANGLALFENASYMRSLLAECVKAN